jgi:diguanylate cyclase (GGDEF)-like protein/PAS domain S-box-containing protein
LIIENKLEASPFGMSKQQGTPVAGIAPLSEHELYGVLHAGVGTTISVIDKGWIFRYVNAGFARAFDRPAEEVVGRTVSEMYGEKVKLDITPYVERVLQGETVNYERVGRIYDDKDVWRTVTMTPWRDAAGEIQGVITASLKVHELKAANEALHAATERLNSHIENSPLTVIELDANLVVTRCSSRARSMFGVDPGFLIGKPLSEILGKKSPAELTEAFLRLQDGSETRNRVEASFLRADKSRVQLAWFNSALLRGPKELMSVMCLVEDVTARQKAEQALQHLATHDQLTGLPNRRGLQDHLAALLASANGKKRGVSSLYIDLDGFKAVNDRYGHAAGDAVLIEVSARFKRISNGRDFVARLGGDEFIIVIEDDANAARAHSVSRDIFAALAPHCEFDVGGARHSAPIGASIGIASHPPLPADVVELVKRADAAMYEAKRAGKGCVRVAA